MNQRLMSTKEFQTHMRTLKSGFFK